MKETGKKKRKINIWTLCTEITMLQTLKQNGHVRYFILIFL